VSPSYISAAVRARVRAAAHNRCGYCQSSERYVLGILEIDHIILRYMAEAMRKPTSGSPAVCVIASRANRCWPVIRCMGDEFFQVEAKHGGACSWPRPGHTRPGEYQPAPHPGPCVLVWGAHRFSQGNVSWYDSILAEDATYVLVDTPTAMVSSRAGKTSSDDLGGLASLTSPARWH
jgi:hypothetical protein